MVLARIGDDDHVIIKIVSIKLLVEQEKRFHST